MGAGVWKHELHDAAADWFGDLRERFLSPSKSRQPCK
jgi:hypothetical protein